MEKKLSPEWNEQREGVFEDRYALKGEEGELLEEKPKQMWRRLANTIGRNKDEVEEYYKALEDFLFVPAGRQLAGIGSGMKSTYFNCYYLPFHNRSSPEAGRDSRQAIMDTMSTCVEVQARGGGIGLNWSVLRPKGSTVKKVHGESSGTVSWMKAFDGVFSQVEQGGSRRGAAMFLLEAWHPDVLNFVRAKSNNEDVLNMANVSVAVSDEFIKAVKNDEDWDLVFPDTTHPSYDEEWGGDLQKWKDKGYPVEKYDTIKARELWNEIAENAHKSAEPGVIFLEHSNKVSNTQYFEELRGTNPCVTGDTKVNTPTGYEKVKDVETGDTVNTVIGTEQVDKREKYTNRPVYKVFFSDGGSLKVTPDHQFHKKGGGKSIKLTKLKNLEEGDWIRVGSPHTLKDGAKEEYENFLVKGIFLGDGSYGPHAYNNHTITISSNEESIEYNENI